MFPRKAWQSAATVLCLILTCRAEENIGYFWHITDIHFDPSYSTLSSSIAMCHHRVHAQDTVGYYGDFLCDSPEALVHSALEAMVQVKPDPDFVLWTGDNSAHSEDATLSQVYSDNRFLSNLLSRHAFNKSVIVPALGNHDCVPPNMMPPSNYSFYRGFLTRAGYDKLLVGASADTFEKGGYYSRELNKHLRILVLNNVLWYAVNQKTRDMHDPSDQMLWLEQQLQDARTSQQKVYIAGHVSPGFNNRANPEQMPFQLYHNAHSVKFNSLMSEYADVVAAQFYGHQHCHAFVLVSSGSGSVSTAAHLSGSVTPWSSTFPWAVNITLPANPSVRLYKYDRSTGNLLDYTVYFMNLTQANADYDQATNQEGHPTLLWQPLYTFTTAYNMEDASTASMLALYAKMVAREDVLAQYLRYTTSLKDFGPCDDLCVRVYLCAIAHTDAMDHQDCMNSGVAHAKARKQTFHHHFAPSHKNDTSDHTTTMRDVVIGVFVSAFIVICIVWAVVVKRRRMMTGPRYAHFT